MSPISSISKTDKGFEATSKGGVSTLVKSAKVNKTGSSHLNQIGNIEKVNDANNTVTLKFDDNSYGTYKISDLLFS